jgi:poly(hydroxyalkanoate) depolymerase family esterase
MKNPFRAMLKASRMARARPVSAALAFRRLALSLAATPKRAKGRAKPAKRAASPASRPARPGPGSFVDGRFTSPQGKLAYKFYTPRGSARRRLPLVVMLHGCGQSAADFATGTGMNALADELGFLVLYPQQSVRANLGRCWNWHRPGDQKRGSGEPATIAALTRHAIALGRANSARVYIAGISAGGVAAAIVAAAYPELFVAVGVHSGLTGGDVSTLRGALAAMRNGTGASTEAKAGRPLPTIVFHGDQDTIVHPSNAGGFLTDLRRSSARSLSSRTETGRSDGGRSFTRTLHRHGPGPVLLEDWVIHGSGHAWSGGQSSGSHTDPAGPDASRAMLRFFLGRKRPAAGRRSQVTESSAP